MSLESTAENAPTAKHGGGGLMIGLVLLSQKAECAISVSNLTLGWNERLMV